MSKGRDELGQAWSGLCQARHRRPASGSRSYLGGALPRYAVYESALDHPHPTRPRHRTVAPSTGATDPPRRRSIRSSSTTSRPSSHRPPMRTPWRTAPPRGSSETSGPICAAVFWRTASLAPAAPGVATISWSRSVARAAACVLPAPQPRDRRCCATHLPAGHSHHAPTGRVRGAGLRQPPSTQDCRTLRDVCPSWVWSMAGRTPR